MVVSASRNSGTLHRNGEVGCSAGTAQSHQTFLSRAILEFITCSFETWFNAQSLET
jgi:hypothetical protein